MGADFIDQRCHRVALGARLIGRAITRQQSQPVVGRHHFQRNCGKTIGGAGIACRHQGLAQCARCGQEIEDDPASIERRQLGQVVEHDQAGRVVTEVRGQAFADQGRRARLAFGVETDALPK